MRKAQAGLDFLMTYGWALLLIVLVVGALFALGVFDIGSFTGSKAAGFASVTPVGWQVTSAGVMTIKFENHAGSDINVTSVVATLGTDSLAYNTSFSLGNGKQSDTVTVGTFTTPGSSGSSYTVNVQVSYTDTKTGFEYKDAGTVTGKVV
ncbi:MAG: hypothetical protein PHU63_02135 [Candidatus ainarchaeum sp.]|nr:hypothetical protein [Candidatus ainarchaeum sp.]